MVPKLQIYTKVEPLQLGSLKFDEFDRKLFKKSRGTGADLRRSPVCLAFLLIQFTVTATS